VGREKNSSPASVLLSLDNLHSDLIPFKEESNDILILKIILQAVPPFFPSVPNFDLLKQTIQVLGEKGFGPEYDRGIDPQISTMLHPVPVPPGCPIDYGVNWRA
jgi:hypothetical protein